MTKSLVHAGPSLVLKVFYPESGIEKTIGYCMGLNFAVSQGQREIFVVDSPFPAESAQAASPSFVRGQLALFLLKGTTLEGSGLVPYRQSPDGRIQQAASRYMSWRIYDRSTSGLILACDYVKVASYSVSVRTRSVAQVQLEFTGLYATPGPALT
jgi:hypothetical protein